MTLAILPFLLLAAPDELSDARKALSAAIPKGDAAAALPAVAALGKIGNAEAVEALLKGLEQASREFAKVQAKVDQLQKAETARPATEQEEKTGKRTLSAEFKVAIADFTAQMGAFNSIRSAVTDALRATKGAEAVAELKRRLASDSDPDLRARMAYALQGRKDPGVLEALLARLPEERDPAAKVAIVDALPASMPDAARIGGAVRPLLEDASWTVVVAACQALGRLGWKDAVEPLIAALEKQQGLPRAEANRALARITGVDKHSEPAAWKAWWERNREAFQAGTYVPEPAERAGGAPGGTTFYGIPVVSRNPVFVIDASMSMKQPSVWKPPSDVPAPGGLVLRGDRKIDVAQFELKKVLLLLPDGIEFNIVFFHRDVEAFSPMMVTLNKESREKAIAWIDSLELVLQTNIWEGLRKAFGFAGAGADKGPLTRRTVVSGADTFYLLSDGAPTTGIKNPNDLCKAVADENRTRKISIHTIAIEPRQNGERFMKKLAQENNGEYAKRGDAAPKP